MLSTVPKWRSLRWNLSFGKKKKSHWLRSGEYGGCELLEYSFWSKILSLRWQSDRERCCGAAFKCLQSLAGHDVLFLSRSRISRQYCLLTVCPWVTNSLWTTAWLSKNKLACIWLSICSFLFNSGAVSCSFATPNFVVWFRDRTRKSTIHHLLRHIRKKKFSSFSARSRQSKQTFLRFYFCSLVRFFGTNFAKIFLMPHSSVKMSWTAWWFEFKSLPIILTLKRRSDLKWALTLVTFWPFLTCKVFQNEFRLPHLDGHPKMLYAI